MKSRNVKIAVSAASLLLFIPLTASSCSDNSNNQVANAAASADAGNQGQDSANLENNQPTGVFSASNARAEMNKVQAADAHGINTTTFFFAPLGDKPYGFCASKGYPIPGDAESSNPSQIVADPNAAHTSQVLPQMDPNGIYTGATAGDWVDCISKTGGDNISFYEPDLWAPAGNVSVAEWPGLINFNKILSTDVG